MTHKLLGTPLWGWVLVFLVMAGVWYASRQPAQDRHWQAEFARLPEVTRDGEQFTVAQVRDWDWGPDGPKSENYKSEIHNLEDLRRIWWVLEPDPDMKAVAHTFLLMEFSNNQLLGVSVEARAEKDEKWGAIPGMFRSYELIYVFGTARDLLTRRAVTRDHEMYMFPLKLTPAQMQVYAKSLLDRAEALDRKPRWYNTALSNCTNELAKAAHLRWRPSFVLTGAADQGLHRAGLIDGTDLHSVKSQAKIRALVQSLANAPDATFDHALLATLQARSH